MFKAVATSLAGIVHLSKASLRQRLLHHRGLDYSSFAQVAANEPYGPVVLATGLPVPTVARLSEVLADLPGVDLEVQPIRDYPQGPQAGSASHRLRRGDYARRVRAAQIQGLLTQRRDWQGRPGVFLR